LHSAMRGAISAFLSAFCENLRPCSKFMDFTER
jgi:hypothetical protein